MDTLSSMHTFVRAVETGSFSAVARELQTTQPTISKQVAALEERLGTRLLTRSTRTLSLTEDGERYYERALDALEAVEMAEASVKAADTPSGLLRVSCPLTFGAGWIMPRIGAFLACYPEVNLDLRMSDQFVDLVEEGIDVAIRSGRLDDSNFVARRIGTARYVTVATPEYLERNGTPLVPADLSGHDCIIYSGLRTANEWHFESAAGAVSVKVSARIQVNSTIATRDAVLQSLGVALVPVWLVADALEAGSVRTVLADFEPRPMPIHALFLSRRFQPLKARAFVDFLSTELASCNHLAPA